MENNGIKFMWIKKLFINIKINNNTIQNVINEDVILSSNGSKCDCLFL